MIENDKTAATQLVETFERKNSPVIATIPVTDDEVSDYGIIESKLVDGDSFVVDKFLEKPNKDETISRH
ncbi:hypothetical protein HOG21_00565 [bacterium]|nr:hypothetical protein [bacterium]